MTRAHTPDASEEVRVIPFPPCGENSIMLSPSSFFLANPLRWALLGGRGSKEVRAIPFPSVRCKAVLTGQKGGQMTKRPQGILCVFPRPLRMYGRSFCPLKPCVSLSTEGKKEGMRMEKNLTTGSVFKNVVLFSLPYLLS